MYHILHRIKIVTNKPPIKSRHFVSVHLYSNCPFYKHVRKGNFSTHFEKSHGEPTSESLLQSSWDNNGTTFVEDMPPYNYLRRFGPVSLYSSCLVYNVECKCRDILSTRYCEDASAETSELTLQSSWISSGSPDLEELPPYSPVEEKQVKPYWWMRLCGCKIKEKPEYCGEPILLTPEQVANEVLRRKKLNPVKNQCHPLVDKLDGTRPSFNPKDMPAPYSQQTLKSSDEKKETSPDNKSWIEKLFSIFDKKPKTEVVYPPSIPHLKVMTFESYCQSITQMNRTAARFDCSKRDPYVCHNPVSPPFYSQCTNMGTTYVQQAPCANFSKYRTMVSPKLGVPKNPIPPIPPIPIPEKPENLCMPDPPLPPPPRMVCDGKVPIESMPVPFYSECKEPECCKQPITECYEQPSSENVNNELLCKRKGYPSEEETVEGKKPSCPPQPFFSQCSPKYIPKYQEAKDD